MRLSRAFVLLVVMLIGDAAPALSQNWSYDARDIALGAVGANVNPAASLIESPDGYTSIVLPFGLFQILSDTDIYQSSSPGFDPVRAVEYLTSPFHFIVGRTSERSTDALLASDVRRATLSGDLGKYLGFLAPLNGRLANVSASSFGYTFRIHRAGAGARHGIYVGAGPYLSMATEGAIDERLRSDTAEAQVALAVTAGYRGRFAWPVGVGNGSTRDGLYVGANFHVLRGLLYESDDLRLQVNADQGGLIPDRANISVRHREGSDGSGFAVDVGASAVIDRWAVGLAATGVSNRLDWTGLTQTTYSVARVMPGSGELTTVVAVARVDQQVVLPVDYRGTAEYSSDRWRVTLAAGHGFGGSVASGGVERRFKLIELRGGGRYQFDAWEPSVGVGLGLKPGVLLDIAAFGTSANVERRRQLGIAASLRFNHMRRNASATGTHVF